MNAAARSASRSVHLVFLVWDWDPSLGLRRGRDCASARKPAQRGRTVQSGIIQNCYLPDHSACDRPKWLWLAGTDVGNLWVSHIHATKPQPFGTVAGSVAWQVVVLEYSGLNCAPALRSFARGRTVLALAQSQTRVGGGKKDGRCGSPSEPQRSSFSTLSNVLVAGHYRVCWTLNASIRSVQRPAKIAVGTLPP